jgi:hypothetical protein
VIQPLTGSASRDTVVLLGYWPVAAIPIWAASS